MGEILSKKFVEERKSGGVIAEVRQKEQSIRGLKIRILHIRIPRICR